MNDTILQLDLEGVNAYLIRVEEGFVLVDTGGALVTDKNFTTRCALLVHLLEQNGCTPGTLRLILLTHGDNDHVANTAFLKERYGALVALHPADVPMVQTPTLAGMMKSFSYRPVGYRMMFRVLRGVITKATARALADFTPFTPDILLYEGQDLAQYGIAGHIVHLPGHTPGSVGVLLADGSLLAGDTLAGGKKPGSAINAMDFLQMDASVGRMSGMQITTVYPGHGQPFAFALLAGAR